MPTTMSGALIDAVKALPDGDNTLIIYIAGDNGPSAEGSLTGTLNNMMTQNGVPDTVQGQLPHIDEIGGPVAMRTITRSAGPGRVLRPSNG